LVTDDNLLAENRFFLWREVQGNECVIPGFGIGFSCYFCSMSANAGWDNRASRNHYAMADVDGRMYASARYIATFNGAHFAIASEPPLS
jgi:hypothetical protein